MLTVADLEAMPEGSFQVGNTAYNLDYYKSSGKLQELVDLANQAGQYWTHDTGWQTVSGLAQALVPDDTANSVSETAAPENQGGDNLIETRAFFEGKGYTVTWDQASKTITITDPTHGNFVQLDPGQYSWLDYDTTQITDEKAQNILEILSNQQSSIGEMVDRTPLQPEQGDPSAQTTPEQGDENVVVPGAAGKIFGWMFGEPAEASVLDTAKEGVATAVDTVKSGYSTIQETKESVAQAAHGLNMVVQKFAYLAQAWLPWLFIGYFVINILDFDLGLSSRKGLEVNVGKE
jgi:hypothetical protein